MRNKKYVSDKYIKENKSKNNKVIRLYFVIKNKIRF